MNLYLLRHGLAAERSIPGFKLDRDRPLTPEGRKKVRHLASLLNKLQISFDLILTSPYVRAHQTAELFSALLEQGKEIAISQNLAPGQTPRELLREISARQPLPNDLLLVGHEPDLTLLASILLTGQAGLALELKKSGLCKLEAHALRYGRCATLQWLLAPKLVSKLA